MAKQTFTTGQVLTAAQMTSLQQTALGGGSATAKTASYTLVAADAGTTVIMNSASATTITVNTSLFSAGDTVFIVNQGAGVCTITAGTATVNTASSLALSQYETGQLYFLSTSAAIFSEYQQAAASSGSMTLLTSGTFSSSALSLTSISGAYKDLVLIFENYAKNATDTNIRLNSDSGSNYAWAQYASGLTSFNQTTSGTAIQCNQPNISTGTPNSLYLTIYNYANTNSHKAVTALFNGSPQGTKNVVWTIASYASTNAITGILTTDAMTSGSYYLYGVN
jgi:hypothetical protein